MAMIGPYFAEFLSPPGNYTLAVGTSSRNKPLHGMAMWRAVP